MFQSLRGHVLSVRILVAREDDAGDRKVHALSDSRGRDEHSKFRLLRQPLDKRSSVFGEPGMVNAHPVLEQRCQWEVLPHLIDKEPLDVGEVSATNVDAVPINFERRGNSPTVPGLVYENDHRSPSLENLRGRRCQLSR